MYFYSIDQRKKSYCVTGVRINITTIPREKKYLFVICPLNFFFCLLYEHETEKFLVLNFDEEKKVVIDFFFRVS